MNYQLTSLLAWNRQRIYRGLSTRLSFLLTSSPDAPEIDRLRHRLSAIESDNIPY